MIKLSSVKSHKAKKFSFYGKTLMLKITFLAFLSNVQKSKVGRNRDQQSVCDISTTYLQYSRETQVSVPV